MFMWTQKAETVAEVEETGTEISMTSEVVTVDLAAVAEEADSEETVAGNQVVMATMGSAAGIVTVVLEEKPTPRPSETVHLLTKSLSKMNFNLC